MKINNIFAIFSFVLIFCLAFSVVQVQAQVTGQVPLNPRKIPQFVDPLPHFAGARVNAKTATDLWVKAVPSTQVAVSTGTKLATGTVGTPGIGMANVWVYQISTDGTNFTPPLWPAFTIETERFNALNVHFENALNGQRYSDVGLIVDRSLHAADPFMQMPPYTSYIGEPPIVVHLHGGEVTPWSDGGPDAWFMPGNPASPRGHSYVTNVYSYPNTQEAATLWFHDHVLGATRLNVYAGMAGFYFLRDPDEDALKLPGFAGDDLVQEAVGGFNTTPYLPEIEIAIQDRMFDTNGGLYFPNLPPNPLVHPFWTPEFVGDVITVNGKTWPYLSVAPRKYRFRLLNGSNARFYELSFGNGNKLPLITQIGTDGGFLDAPVPIVGKLVLGPGERADVIIDFTGFAGKSFILDNTAKTPYPGGAPVTGSTTGRIMQFVVNGTMVSAANPNNPGSDLSLIPTTLKTNVKLTDFAGNPVTGVPVVKTRQLTLNEVMGPGGPLEVLVNNTKWSGLAHGTTIRQDFTEVTTGGITTYYSEIIDEGTTEIWQIINLTADAHPIHLHLVQFQLMSRQPFNVAGYMAAYAAAFPGGVMLDAYGPPLDYNVDQRLTGETIPTIGGNPNVKPFLLPGTLRPANSNERGWKDTFIMYPGEVTTVIARWAPTDKAADDPVSSLWFPFNPNGGHGYVWHCHIIDHEDNEMMRPYNVSLNPDAPARATLGKKVAFDEGSAEKIVTQSLPDKFNLSQNYPNPFNPSTEIKFNLPEASHVTLKIYNALGQEVATLIDSDVPAGYHTVNLDASSMASGVYVYKIETGKFSKAMKMMLLR